MSATVAEVLDVIDGLCPFALAESWDNVGLQLGEAGTGVESLLMTLDVTAAVIDEAAGGGHGAVLTHHPLIFEPLTAVTDGNAAGLLLQRAARGGLAVISAHTNLDSAPGGLSDLLAEMLGLTGTRPIEGAVREWSKFVTFVPRDDLDRVRSALFEAGAGIIGDYNHCSYYIAGTGTFLPMEGADPSIGRVGRDETVDEIRLELVFPSRLTDEIVAALRGAHSYEEPAYDIYPLQTTRHDAGSGRAGEIGEELTLDQFARRVSETFACPPLRYSGDGNRLVRRAAVIPGSGASYIRACSGIADVLVTGDFKYHDRLLASELGLALIDVPHELSERRALELWEPGLRQKLAAIGVSLELSSESPPARWNTAGSLPGRERQGASEKGGIAGAAPRGKDAGMHQLHVDGGSRGNPGPAGIGAVLTDPEGNTVANISEFIGEATNNIAEYSAMVAGLRLALERNLSRLAVFSDSELIIKQLRGEYKVKNEGLRPYYEQTLALLASLDEYELASVPREANAQADELVNRALDRNG